MLKRLIFTKQVRYYSYIAIEAPTVIDLMIKMLSFNKAAEG
jgi:hypothetical protein